MNNLFQKISERLRQPMCGYWLSVKFICWKCKEDQNVPIQEKPFFHVCKCGAEYRLELNIEIEMIKKGENNER